MQPDPTRRYPALGSTTDINLETHSFFVFFNYYELDESQSGGEQRWRQSPRGRWFRI